MFCHQCGAQVSSEIQFCPICGASLAAAPMPAGAAGWTPPPGEISAHTSRWLGQGWDLVQQDLGVFVLLALVAGLLSSVVPIVLQGPMAAGFHIFCMKKLLGRRADFADLFTGFSFFVPTLVASLLITIFVSVGFMFCILPGIVLAAMYQFTYLFIVDKRLDFWPAMQASYEIFKRDYVGFSLFVLAMGLLNLAGILLCIVGVLFTIPITMAAVTVAYREIAGFDQRTAGAL